MENRELNQNQNQTTVINVEEILQNALNDPSLFSKLDIDELLDNIENKKNDYLENKTMKSITNDVFAVINEIQYISLSEGRDICGRLVGYRHVDEIRELHKGKHVRWITSKGALTNGGIVVNIKFTDGGTNVLCKNAQNRFISYRFDECTTFQKLSAEEQLILMVYSHLENTTS